MLPGTVVLVLHDPLTQHSPDAQTVPHAPQFFGSVRSSVHTPEQTEPEQVPQAPFTHDSLGPHCLPQAPQLNGSQFMSGQKPLHCIPAGHVLHDEPVQVSVAVQRLPQAPQLFGSHLKLTHESSPPATPGQTVLPLVQHEPQVPPAQVSPASQALPQAPQLSGSEFVSAEQEAPQLAAEIRFESRVTAPLRASARPARLARVIKEMLVSARMFPVKTESVPSVAELPTCQNTRHSAPPRTMTTDELLAVVSLLPIWKMKSALGSFSASRMSLPVSCASEERQ